VAEELLEGTVTILFTDVEGSTNLTTNQGDERARELLRAHDEIVRNQIGKHGGREVKAMGDGFMVAFSSARRAVRCAAGIQKELDHFRSHNPAQPPVRIGLNTGEVTSEGSDLFGEAVNAASRIASTAAGGEILISEITSTLAGNLPDLPVIDRGPVELKGFPTPWRLFEVEWKAPQPTTHAGRTPFAGRESERDDLTHHLESALAGAGSLVLIGGEPGVGKTRLAQEISEESKQRGMLSLQGRAYEMEGAAPFTPFVEMLEAARHVVRPERFREALGEDAGEVARVMPDLRKLFDDIPPALDLPAEQERRFVFRSIGEVIARATAIAPLFILLDDVHWADEPSLLLLEHVAERLHELPVFIVATYRDVELDTQRPLARTLENLLRRRLAHRVVLRPLPEQAVEAMLAGLAGQAPPLNLVKAIFDATEGNPFFVEEVFQHLSEEGKLFDGHGKFLGALDAADLGVPESVRLVIGRRLARIGEDGRKALAAAAVIGKGFSFELLRSLPGIDERQLLDAIDAAEAARLIVTASSGRDIEYSFAHDLIRKTLLDTLSLPRRQRIHADVADAIGRSCGNDPNARITDIAYHLYQAGAAVDATRTVDYLVRAGDLAMNASAYEEAHRTYENALSLAGDDKPVLGKLLYQLGFAHRSLFKPEAALKSWRQALTIFEELGENEEVGRLCWEIAYQEAWSSRWAEALEMAQRGLSNLGAHDTLDRKRMTGLAGAIVSLAGSHDEGESMIDDAIAHMDETVDGRTRGLALTAKAIHHIAWANPAAAIEVGFKAAELLKSAGALWDLATILGFMVQALLFTGRFEEGEALAQTKVQPLAERLGNQGALLFATFPNLFIRDWQPEHFLGHFEQFVDTRMDLSESLASQAALAHGWRGILQLWRGRLDGAAESFNEAILLEGPGAFSSAQILPILVAAYRGGRDEVQPIYEKISPGFPKPNEPVSFGTLTQILYAVEALYLAGMHDQAAHHYDRISEALNRGLAVRSYDLHPLQSLAGIAAAAAADWPKSQSHFEAALQMVDSKKEEQVQRPEVRRFYAQMLLTRNSDGDHAKAITLLKEAQASYQSLGMPLHKQLTSDLLTHFN
jgi:class 3 adenylate cyclase/tetratricopeptide (TPR) repeat protein